MRNGTIVLHKNCYLTGINSVTLTVLKLSFSQVDNKYNRLIDFEKVLSISKLTTVVKVNCNLRGPAPKKRPMISG